MGVVRYHRRIQEFLYAAVQVNLHHNLVVFYVYIKQTLAQCTINQFFYLFLQFLPSSQKQDLPASMVAVATVEKALVEC